MQDCTSLFTFREGLSTLYKACPHGIVDAQGNYPQ